MYLSIYIYLYLSINLCIGASSGIGKELLDQSTSYQDQK
jgi:hypothetical protein